MSERQDGWYWVNEGFAWEPAEKRGNVYYVTGSQQCRMDSSFKRIGARIPAPDEPWQCVPLKMGDEMYDALSSTLGGVDHMFDEAYRDMLKAAPKP